MRAKRFHATDTRQSLAYAMDGTYRVQRRSCHFPEAAVHRPLRWQPLKTMVGMFARVNLSELGMLL